MTSSRMQLLPGRNGARHLSRIAPAMSELHGHRSRLTPLQLASYRTPTPEPPICRAAGRPPPAGRVTALTDRDLPARTSPAQTPTSGTPLPGPAPATGTDGRTVRLPRPGAPP